MQVHFKPCKKAVSCPFDKFTTCGFDKTHPKPMQSRQIFFDVLGRVVIVEIFARIRDVTDPNDTARTTAKFKPVFVAHQPVSRCGPYGVPYPSSGGFLALAAC